MSCTYMIEVYYKSPPDPNREAALTARVEKLGGRFTFREDPDQRETGSVCVTYEFNDSQRADAAAAELRREGEYVEGPVDYSD